MARTLRISGRSVSDCRDRGEKIFDNPKIISTYLMQDQNVTMSPVFRPVFRLFSFRFVSFSPFRRFVS
mgnify:CR=1 FL=1